MAPILTAEHVFRRVAAHCARVDEPVRTRSEPTLLARKRPTVAPPEGLLTEAVLKHACVVPNRRP